MPITQSNIKVAIITGSTRPGRQSLDVANWVAEVGKSRTTALYEVLDIANDVLPLYNEPLPPMADQYQHSHTVRWASLVSQYDAYVFVTPEYNHSTTAALKNALDYLFKEWNDKAAGFVSYGVEGGGRAVEHLRQICGELKLADVRTSVSLRFGLDFEGFSTFTPQPNREEELNQLFNDLEGWGHALRSLREDQLSQPV